MYPSYAGLSVPSGNGVGGFSGAPGMTTAADLEMQINPAVITNRST